MDDEKNLPYLSAVLRETMRIAPVTARPLRELSEDIQVDGYTIPKGTTLMLFSYAMLNDPKLWIRPEVFNPDRFLEEEKEIVIRGGEIPRDKSQKNQSYLESENAYVQVSSSQRKSSFYKSLTIFGLLNSQTSCVR
jgi:cytochrome P450